MKQSFVSPLKENLLRPFYNSLKSFLESSPRFKNILKILMSFLCTKVKELHRVLSLIIEKLLTQSGPSLLSQKVISCEANLKYFDELKACLPHLAYQPLISILVPVYKIKYEYLQEMLESIAFQIYPNWQLCIVDDCSNDQEITKMIEAFAKRFPDKVAINKNQKNEHICVTSNNALSMAKGDYTILLDHDDRLYPQALIECVRYINKFQEPDILYSDERKINDKGDLSGPIFLKPSFSPNLLLSQNYITHLLVCRTKLLKQCGGFRVGYEGAQDHDLTLRLTELTQKEIVHIPLCLYQWRAHSNSVAEDMNHKPYAAIAGEKAVKDALIRRKVDAEVFYKTEPYHQYEICYKIKQPFPLVSIVIPSKNNTKYLSQCLDSIYTKTQYKNFEIILVDNGSKESDFISLLNEYKHKKPNFFVINSPGPFNFAYLNEKGSENSRGDYLLFLNDDCEVISPNWIEQLLQYAQNKNIGAVGAKLLYADKKIQHGGVFLRSKWIAGHFGYKIPEKKSQSLATGILNKVHEVSALTAACLMIKKELFKSLNGFDKCHVPNGYGDIDLCLRLLEKKYLNIYNPNCVLFHHESTSDKRSEKNEVHARLHMRKRYGHLLLNDPYNNPNVSLDSYSYEAEEDINKYEISGDLFSYFLKNPLTKWNTKDYKKYMQFARKT